MVLVHEPLDKPAPSPVTSQKINPHVAQWRAGDVCSLTAVLEKQPSLGGASTATLALGQLANPRHSMGLPYMPTSGWFWGGQLIGIIMAVPLISGVRAIYRHGVLPIKIHGFSRRSGQATWDLLDQHMRKSPVKAVKAHSPPEVGQGLRSFRFVRVLCRSWTIRKIHDEHCCFFLFLVIPKIDRNDIQCTTYPIYLGKRGGKTMPSTSMIGGS